MYSPDGYEKENKIQMFNSHHGGWFNSYTNANHTKSVTTTHNNISHMKQSTSTRQFTQVRSEQNLHILKLQSRALQQLRKLQHQKFQIYTLTQQTQRLMKQCDNQKSYIKTINIDMMRQQYEQELKFLQQEKNKLLDLTATIKHDYVVAHEEQQQRIQEARLDNMLLSQKIQHALAKKQQLIKQKHQNTLVKQQYQHKITQQEDKLHQLRHIERKVAISLKEIDRLKNQFYQIQTK